MKCRNWKKCRNKTGGGQKHKQCWREWQLCGECAVIEHPESYHPNYVKQMHTRMKTKGVIWYLQ